MCEKKVFDIGAAAGSDIFLDFDTYEMMSLPASTMTHAGAAQPDAASLDVLLTYAQARGIRIENFREAARLKAPAYYAGSENTAFRVMPDGKTYFALSDASIRTMIARAYELGCISPSANAIDSLTAVWTGTIPLVGTSIDPTHIVVTAHLHDGSTRAITDFTVDGSLTMSEGENTLILRYGTLTAELVLTAAASENGATTFLAEHTTVYNGSSERDRVWFAMHMEAGTYALYIALSEPMGASTSTSTSALKLKQPECLGTSAGRSYSICRRKPCRTGRASTEPLRLLKLQTDSSCMRNCSRRACRSKSM